MQYLRSSAALLGLLTLAALPARATFPLLGTDDFGDATLDIGEGSRWTYSSNINFEYEPGQFYTLTMWTESAGRLHLENDGGEAYIGWTSPDTNANGFDTDLLITTTLTIGNALPGVDHRVGLRLYTWSQSAAEVPVHPADRFDAGVHNARYEVWIDSNGDNPLAYLSRSIWDGDSWNTTQSQYSQPSGVTDITLGLFWSTEDSVLRGFWQSADEPDTFNMISGVQPFGADAGESAIYNNGFGLELFGTYANGYDSGISFDSMSVQSLSPVPEPSTYAALAGGLMLGVAVLRRRRNPASQTGRATQP